MAEFTSTGSYFRFEQAVKRETRYVYDGEIREFLATVMETSKTRKESIEESSVLWRAQRGYTWRIENAGTEEEFDVRDAFEPDRMVPKAEFVSDGRVNPRGIPCLYLASTKDAAMAEVRPWVGSYISLAQFKVIRDVTVVDCSKDKRIFPKLAADKEQDTRRTAGGGRVGGNQRYPDRLRSPWNKNVAVAYFYPATSRRFRGATWSVFHAARTHSQGAPLPFREARELINRSDTASLPVRDRALIYTFARVGAVIRDEGGQGLSSPRLTKLGSPP